jgi:Tfp pilus assembly protein PilW
VRVVNDSEGVDQMTKASVQTKARQAASAFIREAREAGWQRAKFEIKPDGSVIVDANMVAPEAADDFLNSDLRMGE